MAEKNMDAKISVDFEESSSRQQLNSGEDITTLFGKIRKFFSDLKAVAFSGAYSDLSGVPDLTQYATKAELDTKAEKTLYGDTTINVGRNETTTVGEYSSALGYQTVASGNYSHAEGHTAAATGSCSHAEGYSTQATGYDSHAGGYASTAAGAISFAHGSHVSVKNENEVGFGAYNKSSDNTLFSIGDGTSWSEQHNAFEITTTGGKLHDKDIATTDLIPTELPADGGNADYAKTLSDWAGTSLTNANDAPLGISRIHGENFSDGGNAPFDFWTTILTLGPNERDDYRQQFAFPWSRSESEFFPKYRVLDNGTWGEWIQIYTSVNKPYVTGSATVNANSNVCVSNHGFTPSAVIWWDGNSSGVAVSFNETQFVMNMAQTDDRTVNYLIFK